jgi:hypothetical protein
LTCKPLIRLSLVGIQRPPLLKSDMLVQCNAAFRDPGLRLRHEDIDRDAIERLRYAMSS